MAKVLAGEHAAGRLIGRSLVLNDHSLPPDIALEGRAAGGSRLSFVGSAWYGAVKYTHFAYDFVGMARAHCDIPFLKRPYLTFLHGIECWEAAFPSRMSRLRRAGLLLSNSEYTRDRADRIHGGLGHAHICWLATEVDSLPADGGRVDGPPTVLIVGRIDGRENYKGHEQLIDAWPSVLAAVPSARLLIVGRGSGLEALQKQSARLPARSVEFRGFVPEAQIDRVWSEADVFAMPSRGEGFGVVYIEAMRHCVPVIASVHDAGQEVNVHGVTGYNVNLDRRGELAEAVIELLQNPARAAGMGRHGRDRWREHFRFSAFRERFLSLLGPWLEGGQ